MFIQLAPGEQNETDTDWETRSQENRSKTHWTEHNPDTWRSPTMLCMAHHWKFLILLNTFIFHCILTVLPPFPMTLPAAEEGTFIWVSSFTSSFAVKKFSSFSFPNILPWAWNAEAKTLFFRGMIGYNSAKGLYISYQPSYTFGTKLTFSIIHSFHCT